MKSALTDSGLSFEKEKLYREHEADANRFNLRCLVVLCIFVIICELLNELRIFIVDLAVMRFATVFGFFFLFLPVLIWLIYDCVFRKWRPASRAQSRENDAFAEDRAERTSITEWSGFKFILLFSAYVGILFICITLSFHAVIILPLPAILAAQYSEYRKLQLWTVLGTVLIVPLSIYCSYFFGLPDQNFFYVLIPAGETLPLKTRVEMTTPHRLLTLMIFYAIPRMMALVAIDGLTIGIVKRNARMLEIQSVMASKVQEEMQERNLMLSHVIDDLAALIETRDIGTGEHVIRTKQYAGMLAREMQKDERYHDQLPDSVIETIENAAPLHDVGKIAISDTILLKPGRLTPEEFEEIKTHTSKGGQMVQGIFSNFNDTAFLNMAEEIASSHHEWWNGRGYPKGLKGEEIPLAARIMAVADVYDALVSKRVYKDPIVHEQALEIIFSESGTHFDPGVIDALRRIQDQIPAIYGKGGGISQSVKE